MKTVATSTKFIILPALIWLAFLTFHYFAVPQITGAVYEMDVVSPMINTLMVIIIGALSTYGLARLLFADNLRMHLIAPLLFVSSPITLSVGILETAPFWEIVFSNGLVVEILFLMPYMLWPHFWVCVSEYKSAKKKDIFYLSALAGFAVIAVTFALNMQPYNVFWLIPSTVAVSIIGARILTPHRSTQALDPKIEQLFYIYLVLLNLIQFFPAFLNFVGLGDTPFQLDVDYSKNSGHIIMSFVAILFATILFNYKPASRMKALLVSILVMNALLLSLIAVQAKKHSIYTPQDIVPAVVASSMNK